MGLQCATLRVVLGRSACGQLFCRLCISIMFVLNLAPTILAVKRRPAAASGAVLTAPDAPAAKVSKVGHAMPEEARTPFQLYQQAVLGHFQAHREILVGVPYAWWPRSVTQLTGIDNYCII